MIQSKVMSRIFSKEGIKIEISVQEVRECCDCENKYPAFGNFRDKVIDKAVKEINRVTMYKMGYSYIKQGRNVVSIIFDVNVSYNF